MESGTVFHPMCKKHVKPSIMNTMKRIMLLAVTVVTTVAANAQASPGEIHGRVFDKKDAPCLSTTVVWVDVAGSKRKTSLDEDGRFIIKPLDAGTYYVHIRVMERTDTIVRPIEVRPNEISKIANVYLDQIEEDGTELEKVDIVADKLVDPDQPAVLKMNSKQLEHMPVKRNIKELAAVMSSDVKTVNGNAYIRGSRADAVLYVIDGLKQSDRIINVPGSAINNVMVYTGGVPAKYGDCTGGVVIVETKSYFNLYYEWLSKQ
jgi:hypothetical protein